MNLPFSLALTSTNIYGLLWNPWATAVANSVNNTILTNLDEAEQERYGLLMPSNREVVLTGFAIGTDTAAAKCDIGIWDTVAAEFHSLYSINATDLDGGHLERRFVGSGLLLPVSATRIPAIKLTGAAATALITGDLDLYIVCSDASTPSGVGPTIPSQFIQDEQSANLLAEQSPFLSITEE